MLDVRVGLRRGDFRIDFAQTLPERGITALLGPSGSGKSTVLRVIAGLERPESGCIAHGTTLWFDAARRIHLPPQRRGVGMLFQNFALFGNRTVAENIGYGLPRRRRAAEVARWLERLHLEAYGARYPRELSGGQRQRVALARALAPRPAVLLLDEPFSALDAALRYHLRRELQQVIEGITCHVLLVTHDLDDARHLADRVAVLADGSLQCDGPLRDVLADPGSRVAAEVVGWRNFLSVRFISGRRVAGSWGELELEREPSVDTAWIGIRPEHVRFARGNEAGFAAQIDRVAELGAVRDLSCVLQDGTLLHVHRPWDTPVPAPGEAVRLFLEQRFLRPLSRNAGRVGPRGVGDPTGHPCPVLPEVPRAACSVDERSGTM